MERSVRCKKYLQFEHPKNIAKLKRSIARNVQGLFMKKRIMNMLKRIAFTTKKTISLETEKCNEYRKQPEVMYKMTGKYLTPTKKKAS